jgi:hypothetical protein
MAKDRSEGRDVHFFDARHPSDALGGLILNPTVTHSEFLQMLDILIITSHRYDVSLRGSAGVNLTRCNEPLQPGDYDLELESAEGNLYLPLTYFVNNQKQARYRLLMRFLLPELSLTQ